MLNFNSKIVNYGALALLCYLIYANATQPAQRENASLGSANKCHSKSKQSAILRIDHEKPAAQRTMTERFILWFFKEDIAAKKNAISQPKPQTPNKENDGKDS